MLMALVILSQCVESTERGPWKQSMIQCGMYNICFLGVGGCAGEDMHIVCVTVHSLSMWFSIQLGV